MQPPFLRLLLDWAFSIRLAGHSESRSRERTSFGARHDTLRHECTRVWRTHLSIHSDNHNSSSTRSTHTTTSRVQHQPSPTTLWKLDNYHWILYTLQPCYACHLHARNCRLCASHPSPRGWFRCRNCYRNRVGNAQGQSERKQKKTPHHLPPTHSSLIARSGSPYAPISYATLKDEGLHTTMRIPAPHAIEGCQGYRLQGCLRGSISTAGIRHRGRGRLRVWVCRCRSRSLNYNINLQ
jgi:hypothetical protein